MKNTIVKSAAIFALSAIATTGFTAASAETSEHRTAIIETADLNLNSAKGQARLDARIEAAVRQVCGEAAGIGGSARKSYNQCTATAHESARRGKVELLMSANSGESRQMALVAGN